MHTNHTLQPAQRFVSSDSNLRYLQPFCFGYRSCLYCFRFMLRTLQIDELFASYYLFRSLLSTRLLWLSTTSAHDTFWDASLYVSGSLITYLCFRFTTTPTRMMMNNDHTLLLGLRMHLTKRSTGIWQQYSSSWQERTRILRIPLHFCAPFRKHDARYG